VTGLDHAIRGLEQALNRPLRHQMWRWLVRHRLMSVHDALVRESAGDTDAWLASREDTLARERGALLRRLGELGTRVVEAADIEPVHTELKRLVRDLQRHRQHLNDLVYDGVALEIGGSE